MKANIAIHHREDSFSEQWIEYCKKNNISYTLVNGLDSDILSQLKGFNAFLWHWHQSDHGEVIAAKYVIAAAEQRGLITFPNIQTCWTFDNKIAQKYQLEGIDAPLVPTFIFYDKASALKWINQATWPKVFKLSRGAGSKNVRLVKSIAEAKSLVNQAFSSGFKPAAGQARDAIGRLRSQSARKRVDWWGKLKRLPTTLMEVQFRNKMLGRDIGYLYFQEFIPDNQYDIRITIIGNRAFGCTRNVRENDFRASGSGQIIHDKTRIPEECIRIAFGIAKPLKTQSIALDFIMDANKQPLVVETSYGFCSALSYDCGGYWDSQLVWHEGAVWAGDAIIEDILANILT